ncbi:hypothetical protein BOX15_Mlig001980g1, partial [Macrostomum lignano]
HAMRPLFLLLRRTFSLQAPRQQGYSQTGPVRCYDGTAGAYTECGALHGRPMRMRLGGLRAIIVIVPSLFIGATLSKEGAAFLEENDIFVPDDDDD